MRISDWSSDVCSSDLASLGSRMIQGVAGKTAEDFFHSFAARVSGETVIDQASHAPNVGHHINQSQPAKSQLAVRQRQIVDERIRWLLIGIGVGACTTLLGVLVR